MSITESSWKSLKRETINRYLKEGEEATEIINYEDYYITSFGRVFSSKTKFTYETLDKIDYGCIVWKELKPFYTGRYKTVTLVSKGNRKNILIHKLVYEAFLGSYSKHYFKIVFKDGDPENCNVNNLRLEFKNKSKRTLENYQRQQRLQELLNNY